MNELLRLFAQIALLKRGPQDLPASPLLLALTVMGYCVVNLVVQALLPPAPVTGPWFGALAVEATCMLAWYALLFKAVRRPERFLQTTSAVFGFQAVLSPPMQAVFWLSRRLAADSIWQVPATLMTLGLLIWIVTANSHIVKTALEWSMPPSVALVILQTLSVDLLVNSMFPPIK